MNPVPAAARRRWALAAFALTVLFLALVARFWHPVFGFTVFYQLDAPNDDLKIAAFRELPVYVHRDTGGYDGLYYAQIAHDPTLRDPQLPRAMDNFSYRARRILPPALAWLLGAGQPAWIIHTYALLNVGAWLALAALLWRLLAVADLRSLLAWTGVLFSAGALSSVRLALTDLPALALLAAAMLAAERGRDRAAAVLGALAGLARETSVLALAGLVRRPWFSAGNLARGLAVAAPLAAWLAYVRWRVGPADAGWANFTLPGAGLVEKWQAALAALETVGDKPLAWTTLLATAALTVQAVFFLVRPRLADAWWRFGAVYALLLLLLGTAVWEGFPGAATRVLLPLTLAFNVLAVRTRAHVAWLVAGNLAVLSGLLAVRDVPQQTDELVAQRLRGTAAVVRFAGDWFGREEDRRHTWLWTQAHGTLTYETLPPVAAPLRIEFGLRSLAPRTVVLRHDGREVWRGEVTSTLARHTVVLAPAAGGRGTLAFSTDTPPTPEHDAPGARGLAFALYDMRVSLAER